MQNSGIDILYLYDALLGNSTFDSRYKFTAKELDNELRSNRRTPLKSKIDVRQTNYTFTSTSSVRRFGARYNDSDLSSWLSADPMASDYPSFSPYMYCAGNPLRFVDPDGEKIYIIDPATGEKHLYIPGQTLLNSPEGSYMYKVSYTLDGISSSGRDKYQIVSTLASDDTDIVISESDWNKHCCVSPTSMGGVIPWSPEGGIVVSFLRRQTPAMVLLHELAHIFYEKYDPTGEVSNRPNIGTMTTEEYLKAVDKYDDDMRRKTGNYQTYSDMWIIKEVEPPMKGARRSSHSYSGYYRAKNSFSLRGKREKTESKPSF